MSKFPYLGRAEHSYGDYLKLTGREASSFFANPGIKVFPDFRIKYKDLAAFHKTAGNATSISPGKKMRIPRKSAVKRFPTIFQPILKLSSVDAVRG